MGAGMSGKTRIAHMINHIIIIWQLAVGTHTSSHMKRIIYIFANINTFTSGYTRTFVSDFFLRTRLDETTQSTLLAAACGCDTEGGCRANQLWKAAFFCIGKRHRRQEEKLDNSKIGCDGLQALIMCRELEGRPNKNCNYFFVHHSAKASTVPSCRSTVAVSCQVFHLQKCGRNQP